MSTFVERGRLSGTSHDLLDPARPRAHEHHAVSKQDGLFHGVGDEDDGRPLLLPDREQLLLEQAARLLVERAERLVHEQHLGLARRARGPGRRAAACRPTAPSDSASRTRSARRSRSARWRVRSRFCLDMPAISRPNATLSRTLIQGSSAKLWKTIARSGPGPRTGWPLTLISPSSQRSRPAISRSRVVLPHPEGPRIVRNSLSWTVRLRSLRARTGSEFALSREKLADAFDLDQLLGLSVCQARLGRPGRRRDAPASARSRSG